MLANGLGAHIGGDHKSAGAQHLCLVCLRGFFRRWHEDAAIFDAGYAQQQLVHIGQRVALAGDIELVGIAAQQFKLALALERNAVTQPHGLGQANTVHKGLPVLLRHMRPVQQLPAGAVQRASAGDLVGVGGAKDFVHRRLHVRLHLLGQLGAQRRSRAQHGLQCGPGQCTLHAGVEVKRCAHQHARRGHLGQSCRDIGGEERLFVPDGAAAMQGQQNAGFKTVHVLPGHGGDNVQPLRRQAARGRAGVVHQAAPGFAVGHRRARGARGEHDGGQMLARHLGNRRGIRGLARHLHVGRQINAGQRMGGHVAARVGQQDQVLWIRLGQLLQHLLGDGRRHQGGFAGNHSGGKAQQKMVAVGADIDHVLLRRQAARQGLHLGHKLLRGDYALGAIGNGRIQRVAGQGVVIRHRVCRCAAGGDWGAHETWPSRKWRSIARQVETKPLR